MYSCYCERATWRHLWCPICKGVCTYPLLFVISPETCQYWISKGSETCGHYYWNWSQCFPWLCWHSKGPLYWRYCQTTTGSLRHCHLLSLHSKGPSVEVLLPFNHDQASKQTINIYMWYLINISRQLAQEVNIIAWLASNLAIKSNYESYSRTLSWLRSRITFSLLRSAIQCIRGSRSSRGQPARSQNHPSVDLANSELNFNEWIFGFTWL